MSVWEILFKGCTEEELEDLKSLPEGTLALDPKIVQNWAAREDQDEG